MQKNIWLCLLLSGCFSNILGQTLSQETVILETDFGTMKIKLFEETPLHKANFLKLAREHFFDSLLFHRVINDFMIQGGDPLSKLAKEGDTLGHGDIGYTIPAEFDPRLFHKKGMLCAARESDAINPDKASSASQFYLVKGKARSPEDLKKYEDRINKKRLENTGMAFTRSEEGQKFILKMDQYKKEGKDDSALVLKNKIDSIVMAQHLTVKPYQFNQQQIETYTSVGGTPHLDGTYTVFGEVTEGMEVIDIISQVATDKRDRPLKDVRMKMKVIE